MELSKYRIKNSTKCSCGHEFSIMDAKGMIANNDYHYYGGRVERYSIVTCPKCGKTYALFIEAVNNGYRVFDIAEDTTKKPVIVKKAVPQDANKAKNAPKKPQDASMPVTETKLVKNNPGDNSCQCKKCGRIFKSVSGLRSHERKCL